MTFATEFRKIHIICPYKPKYNIFPKFGLYGKNE